MDGTPVPTCFIAVAGAWPRAARTLPCSPPRLTQHSAGRRGGSLPGLATWGSLVWVAVRFALTNARPQARSSCLQASPIARSKPTPSSPLVSIGRQHCHGTVGSTISGGVPGFAGNPTTGFRRTHHENRRCTPDRRRGTEPTDRDTLTASLERIQRTAAMIIEGIQAADPLLQRAAA